MIRHLTLIVSFVIGASFASEAHHDKDKFRRVSVNDGLSQNSIFRIIQDHKGFVWIATQDGLNRYDGYDFKVYKHNPDDENSLSENVITAIYEDTDGVLWVGTQKGGLNRFDPDAESFTHFEHDEEDPESIPAGMMMAITQDEQGRIWVGTHEGLGRMDRESSNFTRYTNDPERYRTIGAGFVTSILTDSKGTLWIGTWEGGLSRYAPSTDDFDVFAYDPVNTAGLPSSRVTALYEDHSGDLWVGTVEGLSRFDRQSETFETITHDPDDPNSISGNAVSSILEDGSGSLWVGTFNKGLNKSNPERTAFTRFQHKPDDPGSLSHNSVISLIEDRSGVVWAGTNLGGINQVDQHRVTFEHLVHDPKDENSLSDNTIWALHEGPTGTLWIGSNAGGLDRYNRSTERFDHFRPGKSGAATIRGGFVRAIHEDSDGSVWLATQQGLQIFVPGRGVIRHFKYEEGKADSPTSQFVADILEDRRGNLWIGGNGGIDRYDRRRKEFTHVLQDEREEAEVGPDNILVLYEDSDGNIWAGTRRGLTQYDPETGWFVRYSHDPDDPTSISNDVVYSVLETDDGTIWAGTFGGGLNRLDKQTGTFRRWTEQNSALPTNTVFGVLADEAGYLWLSTHRGLTRFDPMTETFRVFGVHHGVQSPEFNSGAFHKGGVSGDLYFGGINGVNIVRPGVMQDNPHPPEVLLTDVRLHSRSLDATNRAHPISGAWRTDDLRLTHDQNDLWIDYVGLHYSLPEANQYAYMLENYDEHWRYVGDSRGASYTNLDPGHYRFRVKAANADGVWNDEGASLAITIDPPWWKTTVAYASYLVLLILGVFVVDSVQRRRVIRQERERMAIREARVRAKALEIKNERQTRELEEARELQLSMLPRAVPDHPTVEIEAFMKTATEVGGDYYDFHVTDDGILTVAIGDATNHGARAGTMVTAVKSLFNVLVDEHDLEAVIQRATTSLKRMQLGQLYMALALAKVRGSSMSLAGAGMPPALIFRHEDGIIEEVSLSGMPLGSLLNYPYEVSTVQLSAGDTVLLMSDGFAERFNPDGELFGYERAREAFSTVAGRSPAEIIDSLVRVSDEWGENDSPTDDMTFVVMRTKRDIPPDEKGAAA